MKKFICGLLIGLLLSLPLATFASGQALRLVVNGQDITAEAQPVIIDGRTLVPARAVAEKLNAAVTWDAVSQTVTVTSKGTEIIKSDSFELTDEWADQKELSHAYNLSFVPITEKIDGLNYVVALDVAVADIWTVNDPIFRVSIEDGTLFSDLRKGGVYVKKPYVEEQLKKAGLL